MPSYKLTYFNLKGLGEPIRYLLSYMGTDFEDIRLQRDQWSPEQKEGTPFGKLPTLEFDGKTFYDSVAISRYLGAQAGLSGATPIENLAIDQTVGAVGDFLVEMRKVVRAENEEAKKKNKEILINEGIPFYMERFEKLIKENGGYLANGKLSWADFYFIAWCESLQSVTEVDLSQNYPAFKKLRDTVHDFKGVKEWVAKRPRTAI